MTSGVPGMQRGGTKQAVGARAGVDSGHPPNPRPDTASGVQNGRTGLSRHAAARGELQLEQFPPTMRHDSLWLRRRLPRNLGKLTLVVKLSVLNVTGDNVLTKVAA